MGLVGGEGGRVSLSHDAWQLSLSLSLSLSSPITHTLCLSLLFLSSSPSPIAHRCSVPSPAMRSLNSPSLPPPPPPPPPPQEQHHHSRFMNPLRDPSMQRHMERICTHPTSSSSSSSSSSSASLHGLLPSYTASLASLAEAQGSVPPRIPHFRVANPPGLPPNSFKYELAHITDFPPSSSSSSSSSNLHNNNTTTTNNTHTNTESSNNKTNNNKNNMMMMMVSGADILKGNQLLHRWCPYFKFGYFAANGAIAEAFQCERSIHIVDFNIGQGNQWHSLINAFSQRPGGPPHVSLILSRHPPPPPLETNIFSSAFTKPAYTKNLGCNILVFTLQCPNSSFETPLYF